MTPKDRSLPALTPTSCDPLAGIGSACTPTHVSAEGGNTQSSTHAFSNSTSALQTTSFLTPRLRALQICISSHPHPSSFSKNRPRLEEGEFIVAISYTSTLLPPEALQSFYYAWSEESAATCLMPPGGGCWTAAPVRDQGSPSSNLTQLPVATFQPGEHEQLGKAGEQMCGGEGSGVGQGGMVRRESQFQCTK